MIHKIKFGTDGWRAVIGNTYTFHNVHRVTEGVVSWLKNNNPDATVVLGYDCRFNASLFADEVAKVLAHHGIRVLLADGFVSTPAVSLGVLKHGAQLGIVLTASHNPPEYGGYKLKGDFGGPLPEPQVKEIESLIPDELSVNPDTINQPQLTDSGMIQKVDLETLYIDHVAKHFDLEAIANSKFKFGFDAMYGSGQRIIPALLPQVKTLHCNYNPSFKGISPEPISRNLQEFERFVPDNNLDCGLATDGDADRIALVDADGNFIDAHHVILILIHYLHHYKKMKGDVVTAVSSSNKIARLCEHYGLHLDIVKIGFKYTSELMRVKDILVGGEESGGIAVKGHIPERDGIWMGLVIWEFMAKSGKSLREIIDEIYAIVGRFAFERRDLRLPEDEKQQIVANCKSGVYTAFGKYNVQRLDLTDGFKYILSDDSWVMIRPSGTEPVLRIYAEAENVEAAEAIIDAAIRQVRGAGTVKG